MVSDEEVTRYEDLVKADAAAVAEALSNHNL